MAPLLAPWLCHGLYGGSRLQFPLVSTPVTALLLMLLKEKHSDGTREWSR